MAAESKTIAVCLPQVPFTVGGAELLTDALVRHLRRRGFAAEKIQIPFSFFPKKQLILDALVWRLQEMKDITGRPFDVVIPMKFPAYMMRHPARVVWMCHQHRAAYDLFDTPYSDFADDAEGRYYRDLIRTMDQRTLPECRKIFTISDVVRQRLKDYNHLEAETLHIPMIRDLPLHGGEYGDYLLHVGRLNLTKRIDLVLEALKHCSPQVRLVLAGQGECEADLQAKAAALGVQDRVQFLGFVSESDLVNLYANAFAVFFAPRDEDFGLITIEAFNAHRPVITCTDSGGPLEFVRDGVSGFTCEPLPEQIGSRIEQLYHDRGLCARMGEAGFERVRELTWDHVIERLAAYF